MSHSSSLEREGSSTELEIEKIITDIARSSRDSSRALAKASTSAKNGSLIAMADGLLKESDYILEENKKDLEGLDTTNLTGAYLDRLTLTPQRIDAMADGLREVAALGDPVGEVLRMWKRPNGLLVGKMRIPLGVVGIIYEARPNVTADAAGICVKAGNSVILRGGSDSIRSNRAIGEILRGALESFDIPADAVNIVPITDRVAVTYMLKLEDYIDLIIPRGGEGLIRFVSENSRIPVLKHYKGVCHVFVDESADLKTALEISVNAKVQRPGVCNAMETLLVHRNISRSFLPLVIAKLREEGVELRGCEHTTQIDPDVVPATEQDWYEEYLDLILSIKVVESIDDAVRHIEKYGTMHTESIVTSDYSNSQKFLNSVNSSTVMVNASTRFSDGFELGLGAEIGISTSKLHAFGPMGVEELTSTKFIIYGQGQVRN
ncbi:MAG: glutamate-5-semialdehyde dehydrogenase [Candidatus Dadabacteria bacterium]|nr:glutamate-5-semialdehyde dehydrogenase [Candidatus Dadabacteria bacterium]